MKKKLSLATWIFISMALGILLGVVLYQIGQSDFIIMYIKPFGTIFVNLLKFIVVPVVLISIISGIISMDDIKQVGSIGWKTIVYYFCTTAIAIVIGLVVANLFKKSFPLLETSEAMYEAQQMNVMETLVNIFPTNMWVTFSEANMLQVIVISVLFGAGILVAGEKAQPVKNLVLSLNEVVMVVMMFIIKLTPIGVFCLMSECVATNGPAFLGSLAVVVGVAYLGYIAHMLLVYTVTIKFMGKLSPLRFFKEMIPAMAFAFTSTSSVATLPITMECTEKLGVDTGISSFILPLGATINMDGTAIYMGVTSIFIASCYGINLTLGQMASIILTATLSSIGTAGVSGAGIIMLAMVLESVSIPVAGIGLIIGVDKLFDMGRTCLNITGDASCAIVVSNWEKRNEVQKKCS